ncbi:hypothetical protein BDV06DRAFT_208163 [Aspergillus oleicola]
MAVSSSIPQLYQNYRCFIVFRGQILDLSYLFSSRQLQIIQTTVVLTVLFCFTSSHFNDPALVAVNGRREARASVPTSFTCFVSTSHLPREFQVLSYNLNGSNSRPHCVSCDPVFYPSPNDTWGRALLDGKYPPEVISVTSASKGLLPAMGHRSGTLSMVRWGISS